LNPDIVGEAVYRKNGELIGQFGELPLLTFAEAVQGKKLYLRQKTGDRYDVAINTEPVVAGVIGLKKFSYDLWGDAVNIASRMKSQGLSGQIQVSQTTYEKLKNYYLFEQRGMILVKGKGEMQTYWLTGKKIGKHS